MKSLDFLCASPASTAICSSTDKRATRSMDRRSDHYISDHHRRRSKNDIPAIPCSPQLPKSRKSASKYFSTSASQSSRELRSKSSADIINDLITTPHGSSRHLLSDKTLSEMLQQTDSTLHETDPSEPAMTRILSSKEPVMTRILSSREPVMTRSLSSKQPVISRSLSSNDSAFAFTSQSLKPFGQTMSSNDPLLLKSINKQLVASQSARISESPVLKSSSARSQSHYQVVELMVSIHCKGCEGKVRKHISKIEGVTSFSIDRETKKVTVIGEVTPLGVLSSISKVKSAQLWPSPT